MKGRRFHALLRSAGIQHPCDLDLLLFFQRHPHSLLTSERLAAYVGYDLDQVARSLDLLTDAGLLTRLVSLRSAAEIAARTLTLPDAQSVEDLAALLTSAGER
ncbi:MAG: hypothetical protein ACREVV_06495 [Steroidobacteraceae bacterium]